MPTLNIGKDMWVLVRSPIIQQIFINPGIVLEDEQKSRHRSLLGCVYIDSRIAGNEKNGISKYILPASAVAWLVAVPQESFLICHILL